MADLSRLDELLRADEGDAGCTAGEEILDAYVELELAGQDPARVDHRHAFPDPARGPDAAVDQLPRHDAEALRIEIAEIDDVDGHGRNLPHRVSLRRAENGIAAQALTPYFLGRAPGAWLVEKSWLPKFACSTACPTISAI